MTEPAYVIALETIEAAARQFVHAHNARESGAALTALYEALRELDKLREHTTAETNRS